MFQSCEEEGSHLPAFERGGGIVKDVGDFNLKAKAVTVIYVPCSPDSGALMTRCFRVQVRRFFAAKSASELIILGSPLKLTPKRSWAPIYPTV